MLSNSGFRPMLRGLYPQRRETVTELLPKRGGAKTHQSSIRFNVEVSPVVHDVKAQHVTFSSDKGFFELFIIEPNMGNNPLQVFRQTSSLRAIPTTSSPKGQTWCVCERERGLRLKSDKWIKKATVKRYHERLNEKNKHCNRSDDDYKKNRKFHEW